MKKIYLSATLLAMAFMLSYCHSAKKAAAAPKAAPLTFEANVAPIVQASCAPCHVPSKGGNKEALDAYANAKKDIDDIIRRIELAPDARGFMPMRHPKLSDADIAVFKQWKADGLIEK